MFELRLSKSLTASLVTLARSSLPHQMNRISVWPSPPPEPPQPDAASAVQSIKPTNAFTGLLSAKIDDVGDVDRFPGLEAAVGGETSQQRERAVVVRCLASQR